MNYKESLTGFFSPGVVQPLTVFQSAYQLIPSTAPKYSDIIFTDGGRLYGSTNSPPKLDTGVNDSATLADESKGYNWLLDSSFILKNMARDLFLKKEGRTDPVPFVSWFDIWAARDQWKHIRFYHVLLNYMYKKGDISRELLSINDDPWKFLERVKEYPLYGYADIPPLFYEYWGNVCAAFRNKEFLVNYLMSDQVDKRILEQQMMNMERLIFNEDNEWARSINYQLDLVKEARYNAPAINYWSKKGSTPRWDRGDWEVKRNFPAKTLTAYLSLNSSQKAIFLAIWQKEVVDALRGIYQEVKARYEHIIDPSAPVTEDLVLDIKAKSNIFRVIDIPASKASGEPTYRSAAQAPILEKIPEAQRTFTVIDTQTPVQYQEKGLTSEKKFQPSIQTPQGLMTPDQAARYGQNKDSLLPWIVGGTAAAVAAYLALQ